MDAPESEDDKQRFYAEVWPLLAPLLRVARLLCHDEHLADDLVQETMMRAYRSIQTYEPGTNIKAWLMTILRRVNIDAHRRSQRQINVESLDAIEHDPAARPSNNDAPWHNPGELLDRFGDEAIESALRSLPEPMRWTLLLVDVEGMSIAEAAEVLDTAEGTIKSRASRARGQLRDALLPEAIKRGWVEAEPETNQ